MKRWQDDSCGVYPWLQAAPSFSVDKVPAGDNICRVILRLFETKHCENLRGRKLGGPNCNEVQTKLVPLIPPDAKPISAEEKSLCLEAIAQNALGHARLSPNEKKLLRFLHEGPAEGWLLTDLVAKFYLQQHMENPAQNLRGMNSRVRAKVLLFFRSEVNREVQFEVRRSSPGRAIRGRYGLKWFRSPVVESRTIASPAIMEIAFAKLDRDFRYSAMANQGVFKKAISVLRESIMFLVEADDKRGIEGRLPGIDRNIVLPPTMSHPEIVNTDVRTRCSKLLRVTDIVINCKCIQVLAYATLISLKHKYELPWVIVQADQSGKLQMERLEHDGTSAFVITANAPFFMMGEGRGLDYRFIGPIHAEENVLLRRKGTPKNLKPLVVVYSRSSAYEQLLNMQNRRPQHTIWGPTGPWPEEVLETIASAHIELVDTLEELVYRAIRLEPGDFVIAWAPLTDTLRVSQPQLVQVGAEFKHWISLFARQEWLELADEFLWLFAYELQTLHRYPDWCRQRLLTDEDFWYYIGGGLVIDN